MRVLHVFSNSVLIFALFAIFTSTARSEETLVMPYSCMVEGGEPVLTPSDDKGYRIIGTRTQRDFTACSPTRPSHCRRWSIHKFKVDCGGKTVPWASIVAASDGYRSAWVEDGRFVMRMPWTWTLSPDDPCARLRRFGRRPFGRHTRYCNHRRADAPKPTLKMPAGFAPMFGIDAIFVKTNSQQGDNFPDLQRDKEEKSAVVLDADLDGAPRQIPPLPLKNNIRQNGAAVAQNSPPESITPAPESDAPAQEEKKAQSEQQPEKQGETPPEEKTNSHPTPASKETEPTGHPHAPTIINAQLDKPTKTSQPITMPRSVASAPFKAATQKSQTPAAETVKRFDFVPKPQKSSNEVPAGVMAQSGKTGGRDNSPSNIGSNENLDDKLTMVLAGATVLGLGLIVIGIVLLKRKRDSSQEISRDISTVSIGGDKLPAQSATRDVALLKKENQDIANPPEPQKQTPAPPPASKLADAIPKTRKDAFEVLGVSITPDASPTAIKKIVDGLRLSWHPDHAADEADRRIRESRMKQINAAWEIISQRNSEKPESTAIARSEATG